MWNQGVFPLTALGDSPSWPLPTSGGSTCSLAISLCVFVPFPLLIRTPVMFDLGPTLIQYDLSLTNHIYEDLIFE